MKEIVICAHKGDDRFCHHPDRHPSPQSEEGKCAEGSSITFEGTCKKCKSLGKYCGECGFTVLQLQAPKCDPDRQRGWCRTHDHALTNCDAPVQPQAPDGWEKEFDKEFDNLLTFHINVEPAGTSEWYTPEKENVKSFISSLLSRNTEQVWRRAIGSVPKRTSKVRALDAFDNGVNYSRSSLISKAREEGVEVEGMKP